MGEFKLTEEEIAFTPDELDRIAYLREKRALETQSPKGEQRPKDLLKKGDPVYIHLNDTKFTGRIEKVNGDGRYSWNYTYDVSSPHGILKDLDYRQVSKRNLQDLSAIEVPDELKDLSAGTLVKMLRSTYGGYYEYGDPGPGYAWHQGRSYSDLQIKAALIGKPHVPNKRERLRVKEHNKRSKNK